MPQLPVFGLPLPLDQPFSGLVLLTGHASVLRLSQLLCLQYLRSGHPVVLVDATNAFDTLLLSDAARAGGLDLRMMLDAVHLSRVYTCHQLETLIAERLRPAIETFHPRAVLCLGLLDPLGDADVPAAEAARIFRRMVPALDDVSRRLPVLAACPDPAACPREGAPAPGSGERRHGFCARLLHMARWHFAAQAEDAVVRIVRERPDPARWEWTLTHRPGHPYHNQRR